MSTQISFLESQRWETKISRSCKTVSGYPERAVRGVMWWRRTGDGGVRWSRRVQLFRKQQGGPLQFGWNINVPGGSCGSDHKVTRREITATDSHSDHVHAGAESLHRQDGRRRFILHGEDVQRGGNAWMFHRIQLQRIQKIVNQRWVLLIKAKTQTRGRGCRTPEHQVWPLQTNLVFDIWCFRRHDVEAGVHPPSAVTHQRSGCDQFESPGLISASWAGAERQNGLQLSPTLPGLRLECLHLLVFSLICNMSSPVWEVNLFKFPFKSEHERTSHDADAAFTATWCLVRHAQPELNMQLLPWKSVSALIGFGSRIWCFVIQE